MEVDRVTSQRLAKDGRENLPRMPAALRDRAQWVRYRLLQPDARGKRSKVPWHPVECRAASSTDSKSWAPFEIAFRNLGRDETAGLGFVFTAEDDIVGIDLDGVIDEEDRLTPEAAAIVRQFGSYAERSLSGTGVHIFVRGRLPEGGKGRKNAAGYEVYDRGRFFTCTGWQLEETPGELREAQAELIDFLEAHFKAAPAAPRPAPDAPAGGGPASPSGEPQRGPRPSRGRLSNVERARKYLRKIPPAISGQGGHDQTWGAALAIVRGFDLDPDAALRLLLEEYNPSCQPPWSERELRHKVESADRDGKAPRGWLLEARTPGTSAGDRPTRGPGIDGSSAGGGSSRGPAPPARGPIDEVPEVPEVLVPGQHIDDAGELHEIGIVHFADAVLEALPPGALYRRGNSVVGEVVGEPGKRVFRPVTYHRLRAIVDRHVRLMTWRSKVEKGPKDALGEPTKAIVRWKQFCACTADFGQVVLAHALVHPAVRELLTLANYPIYVGERFEIARPGWNPEHGVFYDEPPGLRGLRTDLDVKTRRRILEDLVVDFPLRDEASRQHVYAFQLTPILAPAIDDNRPLALVQSALERTGKTKLIEWVISYIVTGSPAPAVQLGTREPERENRLTSFALSGDTLVHLDNVRDFLDSPALASFATARIWQSREFHTQEPLKCPNSATVLMTANNPKATGEITKRMVPIVLQPAADEPESRTDFKHPNLPAYARLVRLDVLSALLSMIEAWKRDGMEPWPVRLGGFERWSEVIGGVLASTGFSDFLANRADWASAADPMKADLRLLVEAWWEESGSYRVTAQKLYTLADAIDVLPNERTGKGDRGGLTKFGNFLSRQVDRPVRDWTIRRAPYGSANTYYLEQAGPRTQGPSEVPNSGPCGSTT